MPTRKPFTKKTNRISIERNGQVFSIVIEGSIALLTLSIVALAYAVHLLR